MSQRSWKSALIFLAACGCQSSSNSGTPPPLPIAANQSVPTEQAVATAESGQRLGDICDALLLFTRANQGLPPSLADLRAVAPDLNLAAPGGQMYVYVPQGLTAPNANKRLIVYDPQESSDGRRWCILASQLLPGAPLAVEVLEIPEITFRAYLVSGE